MVRLADNLVTFLRRLPGKSRSFNILQLFGAFQAFIGFALPLPVYRGADKSLARPGRKQVTATEDFDFHVSYL